MTIDEVSAHDYRNIFPGKTVYDTVDFNLLNRHKCNSLHFLVFSDSKARLGLILGEQDSSLRSPFSAPFGGFTALRHQPATTYIEAVKELRTQFAASKSIIVTLPPSFYDEDNVAKTSFAMETIGAECRSILNYHFNLSQATDVNHMLSPDQKRNLRIALASGFTFSRLSPRDTVNVDRVYNVISRNRSEKGYYLAMTRDDVTNTLKTVPSDLFIVEQDGTDAAAALVYRVSDTVAQVIYWGDISALSRRHPMSILTTGIIDYYKNAGLAFLDAGPAGDFDELNTGLSAYKERIGGIATVKRQYIINP